MTTQMLLDNDWVIAIEEEIAANPMGIAFAVEPDLCGMYDAQMGLPCQPVERGYRTLGDCEQYCAAYQDATQAWAAQVQAVNDALDEHAEDTAEYEDDILDRLDWMRGNW